MTHHLSIGAAEELAEYFLKIMTQDQRRRLMAERPALYGEIFPDVSHAVILAHVAAGLDQRCATCHRVAHTPESTSYHGHAYATPATTSQEA